MEAREISSPPRVAVLGGSLDTGLERALASESWVLVPCADGAALLETVLGRLPNAVVVALAGDQDLHLLHLLRRAAPQIPLILVAERGDLDLQRTLREMRPYYYDVVPFDADELREAVGSAVRPARGLRAAR